MAWKSISYIEEYSCLSTDTKPTTGVVEGSICYETQANETDVITYKFLQGVWYAMETTV
jgi:hypothetical protein